MSPGLVLVQVGEAVMQHVLITNDDGIRRPGLETLASVAAKVFGRVTVVAPATEMSGVSHGITLKDPMRIHKHENGHYSVDGKPADCVMAALGHICSDDPPVLVLSGINRGPNLGNDVFYSGTVAGAREGMIRGIPAASLSLVGPTRYPFEEVAPVVEKILQLIKEKGIPAGTFLNFNIPTPTEEVTGAFAGVKGVNGLRVTRLGERVYSDEIIMRKDPRGKEYFWIGGAFPTMYEVEGTDCKAVLNGYVSVTPLHLDMTAHRTIEEMQGWGLNAD
jgi:5'-nucleotidase